MGKFLKFIGGVVVAIVIIAGLLFIGLVIFFRFNPIHIGH